MKLDPTTSAARGRTGRWILAAMVLAALALYLEANDRIALWDRDEPRYAMASRYMLQQGDWIVPRVGWGVEPQMWRTAKPVFIYWCQASAMALFGPTVFAARLPSSVAMALTVLLVGWGVRRYAGTTVALWTAGILATSALAIAAAKMCVIDAVLLLWITIAQGCLLHAYLMARRGARAPFGVMLLLWAAIALGGLSKGPVVLGVLGTTMLALALLDVTVKGPGRRWRRTLGWWWHLRPLTGIVVLALIVGPPLFLLEQRAPGFLRQQIFHDVITRTRTALEGHKGPPGFYLATIWGTFFPWCLFLPLALGMGWRYRRILTVRFALAAVIGPWVMMELVQTKLVHYVLPVFPALAFLVARALVRCFDGKHDDLLRPLARFGAGVWGVAACAMALVPWLALGRFDGLPLTAMGLFSVSGIAWGIGVWWLFARRRPHEAVIVMGAGMYLLMMLLSRNYLPDARFLQLSPQIAFLLPHGESTPPGDTRMIGYKEQSLAFYQGGTIDDAPDNFLAVTPKAQWPRWLVIQRDAWNRLRPEQADAYQELFSFKGLNYAGGGKIIEVLISRRRDRLEREWMRRENRPGHLSR